MNDKTSKRSFVSEKSEAKILQNGALGRERKKEIREEIFCFVRLHHRAESVGGHKAPWLRIHNKCKHLFIISAYNDF